METSDNLFLSKFCFSSFRSFVDEQTICFAIPDPSKAGSGLTYIIGENNAGKTSVLEGMHFFEHGYNQSQLRTSDIRDSLIHFTIYDNNNEKIQDLVPVRLNSYSLKNNVFGEKQSNFANNSYPIFVPSRRHWTPFPSNDLDLYNAKAQPYGQNAMLRQSANSGSDNQIADLFHAIEKDDSSYDKFIKTMREIIADFSSFTTINEDMAQISYELAGIRHRADFWGTE